MKEKLVRPKQAGFSLTELIIVIVIILVVLAIALPNLTNTLQMIKTRTAAQEVSDFYQQVRMKAVQDDHYYQVINITVPNSTNSGLLLDMNGDGQVQAGEQIAELLQPVTLTNTNAPAGLGQSNLGFTPLTTESTPAMYATDGNQRAGLAWDARGLPCQRTTQTGICAPGIGWMQHVKYTGSGGKVTWGAVTISPAGRVKVWTYDASASAWH